MAAPAVGELEVPREACSWSRTDAGDRTSALMGRSPGPAVVLPVVMVKWWDPSSPWRRPLEPKVKEPSGSVKPSGNAAGGAGVRRQGRERTARDGAGSLRQDSASSKQHSDRRRH